MDEFLNSQVRVDPQTNAVAFMLIAVLGFSLVPLLLDQPPDEANPFALNAVWQIGRALAFGAYLLWWHRPLVTNPTLWVAIRKQWRSVGLLLGMVAYFNFAFFFWSTKYIDTAVAAIIWESWPFFFVLLLSINKTIGRASEAKVTARTFFLMLLAFVGLALVIIAQPGNTSDLFGQLGTRTLLGVGLVLVATLLAGLAAYRFRWANEVKEQLQNLQECTTEGSTETKDQDNLGLLIVATSIAVAVCGVVNGVVALGLGGIAAFEIDVVSSLWFIVINAVATVFWAKSNLLTSNLGINSFYYMAPVLALGWLALFTEVEVARADLLVIGAAVIVAVSMMINFEAERRLGLITVVVTLWLFGGFVYLREELLQYLWSGGWIWDGDIDYLALLALSGTVFALILAFRTSALLNGRPGKTNMSSICSEGWKLWCIRPK